MTDPQIEKVTGIAASTFHRWRGGKTAPTVDKVRQFCAGLGIPAREALAAMGAAERRATAAEPITQDPDFALLARRLQDPNVSEETKAYIRTTLRMLANMPEQQPRRRRKAG